MPQVKEKLSEDQKRSALLSKCAAKFGKVAKCAASAKSIRTIDSTESDEGKFYCITCFLQYLLIL